jgi:putative inorganic carbon (hco3(-)) transporter
MSAETVSAQLPRTRRLTALSAEALPAIEWLLLGLAAPPLLFGGRYAPFGLLPLAAAWLLRRRLTGRWSVPSAAHGPVLVLLGALAISLLVSSRLDYSLPKLWGILFSLAVFYTCLNTCRDERVIQQVSWPLLAVGLLVAGIGLMYMAEPGSKLLGRGLYELLPSFDRRIQSSTIVIPGISPNQVGGVITLFAPLAFALATAGERQRKVALATGLLLLLALVFTQSRAAIFGTAVALLVGALCWTRGLRRPLNLLLPGGLLLGAIGLGLVAAERLAARLEDGLSLVGRFELWQRSTAMLLDMPATGVGLNNFPAVVMDYYPGFVSLEHYEPEKLVAHAHNLYLQVAVDLGLLGLAAFLALVLLAVRSGLAARRAGLAKPLAAGLLLGLLAHGLYSLVDAIALGARPGFILWTQLGLLIALGSLARERDSSPRLAASRPRRRLRRAALSLVLLGLAGAPFLAAPAALNAALLLLRQRDESSQAVDALAVASLDFAERLAWGPYQARIPAARALAARARGDFAGEAVELERAIALGPWDPSLAELKEETAILQTETRTAAAQWGVHRVFNTYIRRARTAPEELALRFYDRALGVQPSEARALLGIAEVHERAGKSAEAAASLALAVRARGRDPWRTALAQRLVDPSAELPPFESFSARLHPNETVLFTRASQMLARRSDSVGSAYADRLAAMSYSTTANP